MKATFKKSERLCSKKQIAELFEHGESEFVYPFKLLFHKDSSSTHNGKVQVLISVPKKHYKKAYQRNRMKRIFREAFRKNKSELILVCKDKRIDLSLAFILIAKEPLDYGFVEKKVRELLLRIKNHYE